MFWNIFNTLTPSSNDFTYYLTRSSQGSFRVMYVVCRWPWRKIEHKVGMRWKCPSASSGSRAVLSRYGCVPNSTIFWYLSMTEARAKFQGQYSFWRPINALYRRRARPTGNVVLREEITWIRSLVQKLRQCLLMETDWSTQFLFKQKRQSITLGYKTFVLLKNFHMSKLIWT